MVAFNFPYAKVATLASAWPPADYKCSHVRQSVESNEPSPVSTTPVTLVLSHYSLNASSRILILPV